MRRTVRILLRVLIILLLLPVVAVAALFGALNIDAGRSFAAREIGSLTGGMVALDGLSGRFPDHLRLRHLAINDAKGPWLQADDVALDWSPLALLHKQALIHSLTAAHLKLDRLPASTPAPATPAQPGTPFTLPVRVTVEQLAIPDAAIGAPVLGTAAIFDASGDADVLSLEDGKAHLVLAPLPATSAAHYVLNGQITPTTIAATLTVEDPAQGLIARVANLPDIGPLHLVASVNGPRTALATKLDLTAGPLTAAASGTVDLPGARAALDVTAQAPAMAPAPGVSWQAITLAAHVAGPFTAPDATGHLRIDKLTSAGASLGSLTAELAGNAGQASLHATLDTLRLPGPKPDLLAAAPIQLDATARLDDPTRPVTFTVAHPLLAARGTARTAGAQTADVTLTLPDLAPIGALAGLDLAGHSAFRLRVAQQQATNIDVDGTLALTAGPAPAPALLGTATTLGLSARLDGSTVTLSRLSLDGAAVHATASGTSRPEGLDVTARVALDNLALVAPTLLGAAQLDAHVHGPANALAVDATATGTVGAGSIPPAPLRIQAALTGLPGAPAGRITGDGTLAGAPLSLALDAARDADGTLHATIDRADWRSIHAEGALTLPPGSTLPLGRVVARAPHLEDLRPLLGQPIAGGLTATAQLAATSITLEAEAREAGLPTARVAHATVKAKVDNPLDHPTITAAIDAQGLAAGGLTASGRLEASGPETALVLKTNATFEQAEAKGRLEATASVNVPAETARLQTLELTAARPSVPPETARLLGPATLHYGASITIDHLRLGLREAVLDFAGRLAPTLDATVTLRAPAAIAAIAVPDLPLDGTIALDAHLTGTAARPGGTVRLTATGIHARSGPAAAVPPASLTATAQLAGTRAQLDARLIAGSAQLTLAGQAPLGAGGLNLRANGSLDLALLDPILTASGRRARGRLVLDATATGSLASPTLSGAAQLSGGELQDFTQGVHLTDLQGTVRAEGQSVRAAINGRAGPGTVALTGSVGVFAPTRPVDLVITMRNARPLVSDTITAALDADLTVKGSAAALQAAGHVLIRTAELQIPRTLPASVVVLNVRRPGDKPPAPVAAGAPIGLDLTIDAPQAIFVRGRGVDAELSGTLRVRGTSLAPQVGGGLQLRRGSISLAGTTLDFSRGRVGFDGTGVSGKIDPTLDFVAVSAASSVTATLAITGYVSKPKITLSSVPDLPQDEVLAYLLFKRSAKDLGPFQLAEIAASLADLTGAGGGGLNPLDSVRRGLGLDRLSVGGATNPAGTTPTSSTAGPTVEAGRYVADGVYVGARQGTTGGQTGATVQIDITKGLKLETDVGTGQGSNQVGVTYQFEY